MKNLRARPTLRLLSEDINADGRFSDLVSQLRKDPAASRSVWDIEHPIIRKAGQCFGDDPAKDNPDGIIKSVTEYDLYKVRTSEWRGGVWKDADGVNWLIIAGVAKGGHKDHDDFYRRVERAHATSAGVEALKPKREDIEILKAENILAQLHLWKLQVQADTKIVFEKAMKGEPAVFSIVFPPKFAKKLQHSEQVLAEVDIIKLPRADADFIEFEVLFRPAVRWQNSKIFSQLKIQVLTSILPPLHLWVPETDCRYRVFDEPKVWKGRMDALARAVEEQALQPVVPDPYSHYMHKEDIVASSVNGSARRALCGTYSVSTRGIDSLQVCPECLEIYGSLSVVEKGESER